jgi:Flp pilus assembly secretin CpaC
LALVGLVLAAAEVSPCAAQSAMTVSLDKAKVFRYPPNTETIIVGNPIIADVTMLKNSGILILTGKGFGETNLVFLDRAGAVLAEKRLTVEPSGALVTVQRATDRMSYSCHPRCEPTVTLGDSETFMKEAAGGITARNGLAGQGTAAAPH